MTSLKSNMKGLMLSSALRSSLLNTSTALAIALASVTTFAMQAEAQVTTSTVKGTVISAGAPVANATVVITHTPSGSRKTLTTNNNGGYNASGLRVGGPYTIAVTSDKGNSTVEDVYLTLGGVSTIPVNVSTDTAALEEIIVTGSALSGGIQMGAGSAIDQRTMDGIPATGRDFADYVKINPMVNLDPTDNLVGISVAGTNNRFNSITIDGVAQNDDFGLNANGQPGQRNTISMDVVEQIAINIAPFDVQYNGFQGANFNVVTKSGTNEFHGTAYGYLRNDGLTGSKTTDSDGVTSEDLISEFSEKTWGATLGGPIIKDKLFFMAGYEQFSSSTPITTGPSDSSFGNTVDGVTQADLDRAADIAQNVYGFDAGRFGEFDSLKEKDRKIFAKLDWNINEDHRASFTYQNTKGNKIFIRNTSASYGDISLPSAWYDKIEEIETYSLQVFSDWSDNFSTELKISKKDQITEQNPLFGGDFAQVEIGLDTGDSIFLGPDQYRHANFLKNNAWGAKFKATYLAGDHEISAGLEYDAFDVFNLFIPGSEGVYEFDGLDNFEAQIADDFSYTNAFTNVEDDGGAEFSTKQTTLYIQDVWTVNDQFSMQFGLRYERFDTSDTPSFNQNFFDNYGFGNDATLDGKNIFLPRFGFNYAMDERTIIRGGAGLFSGGSPNVWISNNYTNDGQTIVRADLSGLDPAIYLENVSGFDIPQEVQDTLVQGNGSVNYLNPDFKLPSSWKFNLAVEHDFDLGETLGDGYLVTVEALITSVKNATNWEELRAGTQIGTAPDGRPIYNRQSRGSFDLGLINTTEGGAEVFTVAVQKEYDNGVSFNAAYANTSAREVNPGTSSTATSNFGKVGISDRSNFELGTSVFENKHRFTLNLNYVTEFVTDLETRFGFFFETRSGRPFSYTYDQASSSRDIPFGGGAEFERRDRQLVYVPTEGDSAMCYTGCIVGGDATSSAVTEADFLAFLQETGLDQYAGSIAPRNSPRNPWYSKLDFRFTQEIPGLMDGHKGLFSFDITNLTNLLNSSWGRFEQTGFPSLERVGRVSITDDNRYVFTRFNGVGNPRMNTLASVWRMRLGLKYSF
ncbi:MAG: TonB-dependent receptor [Emcibacter sp.]|nr:TonB-dependent receptor [Emcibacter sp.]